jgi:hypothetical protein
MPDPDHSNDGIFLDLAAEADRVRAECRTLESRILPLLLPREQAAGDKERSDGSPDPLATWRRVVRGLAAALPTPDGRPGVPVDEAFLAGFLHQRADAGFRIRRGRIAWRIEVFTPLDLEDWHAAGVLSAMLGEPIPEAGASERLLSRFDDFQDWFLGAGPDVCFVANEMCLLLPICVEFALDFVRRAFDLEGRLERIRSDVLFDGRERTQRLKEWSGPFQMRGFNNALLHVIASLANHHFDQIASFLDHPARIGGYTGLMPHYLVAVLHQKVRILEELSHEESERRGGTWPVPRSCGNSAPYDNPRWLQKRLQFGGTVGPL